jgi:protein-export membrane protein SecD
MQARTRWWLIGIIALVVVSLVGVLEPIKFRDRRDPDTGKVVQPLKRLGPIRLYKPHLGVTLGLDLRGGSHLVLEAQSEARFEYSAPELADLVPQGPLSQAQQRELSEKKTELYGEIVRLLPTEAIGTDKREVEIREQRIIVRTRAKTEEEMRRQGNVIYGLLAQKFPKLERKGEQLQQVTPSDLASVQRIIENRVNAYGVTEPVIQRQPPNRIVVELPGVKDPEQAKELIRRTAVLEFREIPRKYGYGNDRGPTRSEVDGQQVFTFRDPTGKEVPTSQVIEESPVIVTGRDLVENSASVSAVPGQKTAVHFRLKPDAARVFEDFTRRNVNHYLAIVLDGKMISCPIIEETIPHGEVQISGGFDSPGGLEEARDLSILLNAGALPMDLQYVENRTVSAQLGQDALVKSLWAGLIGLAAVLVFMAAYYRVPGLLADLALIIYVILLMGAIRVVNMTLTLPGILAVILSIGMAVDANIIIFERLKEEIRTGKTMRSAVEAAFKRAWAAILDSNVCSIGTGIVLFYFGTGPIKGFAVALVIGVMVSLFTAVTVTRLFMNMVMGTRVAQNIALFGVRPSEVQPA